MDGHTIAPETIIEFWFSATARERWFKSTPEFDEQIRENFEAVFEAAMAQQLRHWERSALGCLALVIVLDQFPLNMYRGEARSFSGEAAARTVAGHALAAGLDRELDAEGRQFLYLPFMHSEDAADQERSVALYSQAGLETRWAEHHRDIIRRFGRFPHRNAILGRESTAAELEYLRSDAAFHG